MLQHDKITLVRAVLHLLLKSSAEGVKSVATGDGLLIGEETDPAETGEKTVTLLVVREVSLRSNSPLEVLLGRRSRAKNLLGGLLPRGGLVENAVRGIVEEANVDEDLDHLGEALVTEGTTNNGLSFRDVVALAEGGGVTVRVSNERETGVDEEGLSGSHQLGAVNADDLAAAVDLGGVTEGKKDTTAISSVSCLSRE